MSEQNLSQMVMYHFSNRAGWEGVTQGNPDCSYGDPRTGNIVDGKEAKGLWPSRRLIPWGIESALVPWEATRPAVFGLPEEKPSSWVEYEDPTRIFDRLLSCCVRAHNYREKRVLVLLRVDLKPEDNPFVVDYVHLRKMAKEVSTEADLKRQQQMIAERNKRYWESRVPLAEYKNDFILPEIVVMAPIPPERVHFVWERDLEEFLEEVHSRSYVAPSSSVMVTHSS